MSENPDSTFLPVPNSVAARLQAAGFHKTGIARAVRELVGEYLGIHANIGLNLVRALGDTNTAASEVLGAPELVLPITSKNDPHLLQGNNKPAANDGQFQKVA